MSTGEELKAQGQQLALDAAEPWPDRARTAIIRLARTGGAFTSEHVIDEVGLPSGEVGTNKNNAVGAAMTAAAKAQIIVRIGYTNSKRASSHGAVIAKWVGIEGQ